MNKSDVARQYRDRYGMEMPTHKLARIMYNENKLLFTNVEVARTFLRSIEGKIGTRTTSGIIATHKAGKRPINPYNLPDSDEVNWIPYTCHGTRILVLSDIHVPYHNVQALTTAMTWGKKMNPDTILLNGDTIDAHSLSRFVKNPKRRDFAGELRMFADLIDVLRNEFKDAQIIFKVGNHEERYDQFLYRKAHELAGVEEFTLENIIRKRSGREIEFVTDKRIIKAGHLNIIHGHEFAQSIFNPVNPARGLFLRGKSSAMQGHNHQTSEHTEPNMDGKIMTTWSVGCLCELHPQYMPINRWNHGCAFIEVEDDGDFLVQNKRIMGGDIF